MDVIHLTTVEKNVLYSVIATHDIDEAAIDHGRVLFAALVHWMEHLNLTLRIDVLVDCGGRATAGDQCITVGQGDGSGVIHEVQVLRISRIGPNTSLRVTIVVDCFYGPLAFFQV